MVEKQEVQIPTDEQAVVENQPQGGENSTAEEQKPDRPEWLPEKFNSPEDLAKAYSELEKKMGEQAKPQNDSQNDNAVDEIVEQAGLQMADLTAEYEENGQLSEDSYAKLEAAGIPREYVDGYIRGQEVLAEQYQASVLNEVGGVENYNKMIEWAAQNLSEQEVAAFNNTVGTGDVEQAKMAVRAVYSKFTSTEGIEPDLVSGGAGGDTGSVFRSTAELVQAMSDPRYKDDPAYRKDVQDKLARSSII